MHIRFRNVLQGNQLVATQVIFRMAPKSRGGRHFGGRLVFDSDGLLYLTLGDRGDRPRAQRLDDHAGSVIRITDGGEVPADNPLLHMDNVIVTPHAAYYSTPAVGQVPQRCGEEVARALSGQRPRNVVNSEVYDRGTR